ncbi:MAG TPA: YiiX/YebB-like N1pC/P60 family cysteine hydrolase [Thermoanaerobaculia bacterium]|nr:YiiX/YebB-like N1pC/P60 family cysteine hydrolase [Thermoanaerobaculia bacterium]
MSRFHSVCVALAAVFLAVPAAPAAARATVVPDVPPASTLETGDFLWPKLPNRVVPYDSRPGAAAAADRQRWEEERRAELARLEHLPALTPQEKERYRILSSLTYDAFLGLYLSDRPEGTVTPLGDLAVVATGHVAIVDVRQGVPYVIEAIPYQGHLGVRDLTYRAWLAGRPGEKVWHARLKDATREQRAKVAAIARGELGKPYLFWNFDLADEHGFYCSKLAWFSVWRAIGQALDGNANAKRALWYSPKQMLHSPLLVVLSSPGPF